MFTAKKTFKTPEPSDNKEQNIDWRLKLDKNENIYGTSKNAIAALRNFNPDEVVLCSDCDEYINKFAEIYEFHKENIYLANGIDTILSSIINIYLGESDVFIYSGVSDDKAGIYADLAGADMISFLKEKLQFDIEIIRKALYCGAKICYITTPDSVTGETLRASNIVKLLEEFPDTLFVVNVSYVNYAKSTDFKDYTDLLDNFSNIIIIKSFIYDYALAGIGTAIAVANCEIINNLKAIAPKYTLNPITLKSLISAIKDIGYFERIKDDNIKARELLYNGLLDLGFKPYESDSNFILCDFNKHCEFYYNKLKNNGVIVKKFDKNTIVSNFLRITVPKISGVKYILQLLKKKDVIIFALENTLINGEKSYDVALAKTFEHFAKYEISQDKIKDAKRSNINPFEAIQKLLQDVYIEASLDEISKVFEEIFSSNTELEDEKQLINQDELLIKEDILEHLSLNYDMAIVTNRTQKEALFALKKFNLDKYFNYIKSNSLLISEMLEECPHKTIELVVSSEEILYSAVRAEIKSTGLILDKNNSSVTINNFKHFGCSEFIFENEDIMNHFETNC